MSRVNAAYLHANSDTYDWLLADLRRLHPQAQPDAALRAVARAAAFAAAFHTGRFADGAIENLALQIGRDLSAHGLPPPQGQGLTPDARPVPGGRRVLHVATHLVDIAGHSRMLARWVRSDAGSTHSVVLTQQGSRALPAWLAPALRASGGDIAELPVAAPLLLRAQWLRWLALAHADLVVLHHDGHDVLPVVAFAHAGGPPVAVLNHADHQFWLGPSVADVVINLRSPGSAFTAARRGVARNVVLPVPLTEAVGAPSRAAARQALGIPASQRMLLSIGRGLKYRPCGGFDFCASAARLLDRLPAAHLFVVGDTAQGIAPYLQAPLHERLHFVGSLSDPTPYRAAADLYVESFPFGSHTALLESALQGLPAVPAYAPLFELLVSNDDALNDLLPNAPDEAAWLESAVALAERPAVADALGAELRRRLLAGHLGHGWQAQLEAVYRVTDALEHRPAPIALTGCDATPADIGLGLWSAATDGRGPAPAGAGHGQRAVAAHSAYVARVVGNYAGARRHAWRALRHDPRGRAGWALMGITLLGAHAGTLRQWVRRSGVAR